MKQGDGSAAIREGIIFILSAPSGTGKTTLINRLLSVFPDIRLSVSCTTRRRRPGEIPGREYHFITPRRFTAMKSKGEFAEWARVHGFLYATPRRLLDRCVGQGRDILLDIDVQGARKIKSVYPQAVATFLVPPSWKELEKRLASRGTDGTETIRRRMANAKSEIRRILKYDYYVINQEVRQAARLLESIITAERLRISRVGKWRIGPLQGAVARTK